MAENTTKSKPFQCKRVGCDKTFESLSGRSKHHRTCDKEEAKGAYTKLPNGKFECNTCDRVIKQLTNMYRHLKGHQQPPKKKEKKIFECVVCSQKFSKHSKLVRHEVIHNKSRLHTCVCNKTYKRIDHFKSHQQTCDLYISIFENDGENMVNNEESLINENTADVPDTFDLPTSSENVRMFGL